MSVLSRTIVATLVLFGLAACGRDRDQPTMEYVPHMMDQPSVKAQKLGPFGEGMRRPPEGTIPVNYEPYRYANDPEGAGRNLSNPLRRNNQVLARGQKLYNTYCIVCHGTRGEGDGSIVPKFPRPPTLQSEKVRGWSDGRIFHTITVGQNLMPGYATQVAAEERWAIIHYVRVLQRSMNPTEQDVKELQATSTK